MKRHITVRRVGALAAALVIAPLVAACAPSGQVAVSSADTGASFGADAIEAVGDYTLTLHIGDARIAALDAIDAAFTKEYPNITIDRTVVSYDELETGAKLILTGSTAPCVIMGDQGGTLDGPLVKAGLLQSMQVYADEYGWPSDPSSQWTEGGAVWGQGDLMGVSPWSQVVGVYFNVEIAEQLGVDDLTTWDDFLDALDVAKAAGVLPISFGNSNRSPATFTYELIQNQVADVDALRDFVFGGEDVSFVNPANVEAADILVDWANTGYFNEGFNGLSGTDARARFTDGASLFYVSGNWSAEAINTVMGDNVGFFVPERSDGNTVSTGWPARPWHVSSSCDEPDVAAAYIDFLMSPESASIIVENNDVPTVAPAGSAEYPSRVGNDLFAASTQVSEDEGFVPFVDRDVAGFSDGLYSALQELMDGRLTPEDFVEQVNAGA